jgi:uncharacterized protein
MPAFSKTVRNRVRRAPERGRYDRAAIYEIIDEAMICHVAFVQDGQPFVIPTIHARLGDRLLFHGATKSRLVLHAAAGQPLSVAVTHLDGLVLARSIFHHSMNYRSVVLFGAGRLVVDDGEKLAGLKALSEHVMPGRWDDVRGPNAKEMKATALVSMGIDSASAKVRRGPPNDDEEDYDLPVWAGVLPVRYDFLDPEPDPRLKPDVPLPPYLRDYRR